MGFRFRDRAQAGCLLAEKLERLAGDPAAVVLALPRGGVPVGYEVAKKLGAPLEIFLACKLGAPGQPELAMGAVAGGGRVFLNDDIIDKLGLSAHAVRRIVAVQQEELQSLEKTLRPSRERLELRDRAVILVDDGLATGATMRVAVAAVRQQQPKRVIVAAPVAARDTLEQFQAVADEVVCVQTPHDFRGVGEWYEDFRQITDDEVRDLLERAAQFHPSVPAR